jgi:hypothetical protein
VCTTPSRFPLPPSHRCTQLQLKVLLRKHAKEAAARVNLLELQRHDRSDLVWDRGGGVGGGVVCPLICAARPIAGQGPPCLGSRSLQLGAV